MATVEVRRSHFLCYYRFMTSLASSLSPLADRYGGKRTAQFIAAVAVYEAVKPLYASGKKHWQKRFRQDFVIKITEKESIYPIIQSWVMANMKIDDQSAVSIATKYTDAKVKLLALYDSDSPQPFMLGEHQIFVSKSAPTFEEDDDGGVLLAPGTPPLSYSSTSSSLIDQLVFTVRSVDARQALLNEFVRLAHEYYNSEYPSSLRMPWRHGGWNVRSDMPARNIDSIFLKEGQLERIVADLGSFLSHEDEYVKMGLNWHRGYLFHGAPGTGKTSIAKALAQHHNLPVHYLPLASVRDDLDLIEMITAVRERSILLLEDVDVYMAMTQRKDDGPNKPTLATMLNCLDGVWTPHGLITIMTTNNIDALDDAMIRSGRCDVIEELSNLDQYQIDNMINYAGLSGDYSEYVGQSPASLVERIKQDKGI